MSRNRYFMVVALAAILSTMVFTGAVTGQEEGGILQRVLDRGTLICGVNSTVPGFGFINDAGEASGFDVDFCHAIAAGVLGDANAVQFVPLTAAERFTAVQTGAVDVLIRNTTHTLTRDTENGMDFGPVTFYDGQGLMVRVADGFASIDDLGGAAICVLAGTTTELNLADKMAARGLEYEPVVYDTSDATLRALEEGRCDALTSDKSQLAGLRSAASDPSLYTILADTLSKEPLGPVYLQGDPQWADVVNWITWGTMQAEEFGITSQNIDDFMDSENPEIRRFLGLEEELGAKLGLSNDFMVNVISQVGNYAEIYERNLFPIGLEVRGLNALWTEGGAHYPPAWR
ncbi:MAG: amino acid ABC transporter substrate-binding protein [Anaerolineae bacterium]